MKQTGSRSISYFKFKNTFQANREDSKHSQIGKTRKKVKDPYDFSKTNFAALLFWEIMALGLPVRLPKVGTD